VLGMLLFGFGIPVGVLGLLGKPVVFVGPVELPVRPAPPVDGAPPRWQKAGKLKMVTAIRKARNACIKVLP